MDFWISELATDFLSDFQKSDEKFIELIKMMIDFLQRENFSNIKVSPLYLINNLERFNNLDEYTDDELKTKFKSILPFKSEEIMEKVFDSLDIRRLIPLLKLLNSMKGSNQSFTFWKHILGNIFNSTPDLDDIDDEYLVRLLNINYDKIDISIDEDNTIPNIIMINNIDELKVSLNALVSFLNDITPVGIIVILLFSTQVSSVYTTTTTASNNEMRSGLVTYDVRRNDYYQPFIKYTEDSTIQDSITSIKQKNRNQFFNAFQIKDVERISFDTILNEGSVQYFSYRTIDNYIYEPNSTRIIGQLDEVLSLDGLKSNEKLNPPTKMKYVDNIIKYETPIDLYVLPYSDIEVISVYSGMNLDEYSYVYVGDEIVVIDIWFP